jgi:diguanylate cyclase (GGDEF)-like protein/PAS domain S-box-containing protein
MLITADTGRHWPGSRVPRTVSAALVSAVSRAARLLDPHGGGLVGPRSEGEARDRAGRELDAGAYLRSAFDAAPIGIALVGIDAGTRGRFLRVNRALCELTGYSTQELEGSTVAAILHPDDLEVGVGAVAKLAAGEITGFRLEQRLIHAGRNAVWTMVSASLARDASGAPMYCIWQIQDIEERKRFERELGYLADHDPLTGLLNRRGFVRALTDQIALARRYGGGGAVLFLDIDDFKHVNDTLGHSVGDQVINDVAHAVGQRLRETDVFARLGGDEFGVLVPHATVSDAETLSESLLQTVRDLNAVALGGGRRVTMSIGIGDFRDPVEDLTPDDVLIDSDLAMYAAKEAGKDRIALAHARTQKRMSSTITWTDRVRRAVKDERFELYCQPIVDLQSDTISQWELLLRLPGDDELILPERFLYTLERSGLILEIDRWVLKEAIRLIAQERDAGHELRLEVNISSQSVGDPELLAFIEQQLDGTGIDPSSLVLEVTETATIANMTRVREFAATLAAFGCGFAVDDFGAAFGSFYYLKHIPYDYIKIDGEFIRHLPASHTDRLILDSIVQLSKALGKRTIAEFVGDEDTVEILKQHGVDYAQGYHIGRPRPVTETLPP